MTSRWYPGNIEVNCEISPSLGTRKPVAFRSVLPVSSFIHSLITEVPEDAPAAPSASGAACGADAFRAVVITSLSSSVDVEAGAVRSSGRARLVRRGARVEPTRGRRKREEMCTAHGGSLYVLRLAISVR